MWRPSRWWRRPTRDGDLDRELRFHLDERVDDLVRQGRSRRDARRRAHAELGGVDAVKEHCRDTRRLRWLDPLRRDLQLGLRSFRRRPGFTATCVVTLALGIGANAALFSVVHAVLLRPLPFEEAERLVVLWERDLSTGRTRRVTPANHRDWRARNASFTDLALIGNGGFTLVGTGEPERLSGALVSDNYFEVLGTRPQLGRTFRPGETEPGADRVAILGHGLWQRRFGGDPDIIGRQLLLDGPAGGTRTVVGVMPPGAYPTVVPVVPALPLDPDRADVWAPLALPPEFRDNRSSHVFGTIGRLRDGVTLDRARADLDRVAATLAERYPENADEGVALVPMREQVVGDVAPALVLLLGFVGAVLLIACGNLAGLGLARASTRQAEVAMRTALGATRGRLLQQLLTESLVIALAGGALGLVVALGGVEVLQALGPAGLPRLHEVSLDGTVLVFVGVLTLVTGLVVGAAPAWHASSRGAARRPGDREVGSGLTVQRFRSALIVAEIGATVVLLVGAGLLLTSFVRLTRVDPGFDAQHVLTAPLALPTSAYVEREQITAFYDALLDRLRGMPGVRSAAAGYDHPLSTSWTDGFTIEGRPPPPPGEALSAAFRPVTVGYFETTGIRLRRGRPLTATDVADAPGAVVVNEAFADRFFPTMPALGQRLAIRTPSGFWGDDVPGVFAVVGIVDNVRFRGLDQAAQPAMYVPLAQFPQPGLDLVLRTETDPRALVPAVRQAVWELDPDLPIGDATTLETLLADSFGERRFAVLLVALFGALAVGVSLTGLYGVLAYVVTQRRREMGVRLALGARPADLFGLVLRHGVLFVGLGLGLGLVGALGLTRLTTSLLYQTSPHDPTTFVAVAAVFALVGVGACLAPARRAMRADPVVALRAD